ncbi:MAG: hypothetical protein ACSW8D_14805 [Prevotella sp.]
MYAITYAPEAKEGLAKLKRSEPAAFKKAVKLLNEIADFHNLALQLHHRNLSVNRCIGHDALHKLRHRSTQFLLEGLVAIGLVLIYLMEEVHVVYRIDDGAVNGDRHSVVL